jgi:hypothetical protein
MDYEKLNESLNNGELSYYNFIDIFDDPSINVDEFFDNVYLKIIENNGTKSFNICSGAYKFISKLSDEQIAKLPYSTIGDHMFFRYLPSVELINKYLSMHKINANILNGIGYNTNISAEERKLIMFSILRNINK